VDRQTALLIFATVVVAWLMLLAAGAAFVWWKIWTSEEKTLARRIGKLSVGDKLSLGIALFRDRRVPLAAKVIALALVLYLASPLDLIPDFIPLFGYVDDLLIVMIGAGLLLRLIPGYVLEEHVAGFEERRRREQMLEGAGRANR